MTKTAHILEVNGRQYNAMTGVLLETTPKSIDGFMVATPSQPASKTMDAHREGSHDVHHHPAQHSHTLMRTAVHHPTDGFKRHTKAVAHTGTLVKASSFDVIPKHSASLLDADRLRRAEHVSQSTYVRRFAPAPARLPAASAPSRDGLAYPTPPQEASSTLQAVAHQASADVFERALAAANSHKQPYVPLKHATKKTHRLRRVTSVVASVVAVFLIVGFVAYQNSTTIQLRLASERAGMTATLPTWQPSGFHVGTFAYKPGGVTVSYKNAASNQYFTIAQTTSNWDSTTLLNDYVYPSNETYNTILSAGTTIYTYGNNNATWVHGGIWYKLTSDGSLTTSQIVNMATSMQS